MLGIDIRIGPDIPLRVLCLGAHSDDIEIGCGGAILRLVSEYPQIEVDWIVFSSQGYRVEEAYASASEFLRAIEHKKVIVGDFRDGFFPYNGAEIKERFEQLKREVSPNLIFTHHRQDLHQDHRLINELTWNTFRDHLILEYEVPKYDGDLGVPNFFVHLDEAICRRKVEYLLEHFRSQRNQHWFTEDTFFSMLRLRGVESRAPSKYAEAFYCRKIILQGNSEQ